MIDHLAVARERFGQQLKRRNTGPIGHAPPGKPGDELAIEEGNGWHLAIFRFAANDPIDYVYGTRFRFNLEILLDESLSVLAFSRALSVALSLLKPHIRTSGPDSSAIVRWPHRGYPSHERILASKGFAQTSKLALRPHGPSLNNATTFDYASIRQATEADAPSVAMLVCALIRSESEFGELTFSADTYSLMQTRLSKLIRSNDCKVLIAEDETGAAIGSLSKQNFRGQWICSMLASRQIGYISDVYTAKQHRRRGVAKALLRESIRSPLESPQYPLGLQYSTRNDSASKLWTSAGFIPQWSTWIASGETIDRI